MSLDHCGLLMEAKFKLTTSELDKFPAVCARSITYMVGGIHTYVVEVGYIRMWWELDRYVCGRSGIHTYVVGLSTYACGRSGIHMYVVGIGIHTYVVGVGHM